MAKKEVNYRDYINLIYNHIYLIISFVIIFAIIGTYVAILEDPVYSAEGKITVGDEEETPYKISGLKKPSYILNYVESYPFITQVIKDLNLQDKSIKPTFLGKIKTKLFGMDTKKDSMRELYHHYESNLNIRYERPGIYTISFTSTDPEISKKFVNEVGNSMIDYSKSVRQNKIQSSLSVIEKQVNQIKSKMNSIRKKTSQLKNTQQYLNVKALKSRITRTKETINSLERELEHMRLEEATIFDKEGLSNETVYKRVELNDRIKYLKNRTKKLRNELEDYQIQYYSSNKSIIDEVEEKDFYLERDKEIYSNLLSKKQEILLGKMTNSPKLTWLSKAWTPTKPDGNRDIVYVVMSIFLGFLLSIALIIILHLSNIKYTSAEETEQELKYPVIGSIPFISLKEEYEIVHSRDTMPEDIQESYNTIRTNLHLAKEKQDIKTISIVSSKDEEGKSLNALNLARGLANAGEKVLLIDMDFRQEDIRYHLELKKKGITDIVNNRNYKGIINDAGNNLDIIASGDTSINAQNFFESNSLEKFLKNMRKKYDQIIIDTAPLLKASETPLLLKRTDASIILHNLLKTKRSEANKVVKRLEELDVKILGILINEKKGA